MDCVCTICARDPNDVWCCPGDTRVALRKGSLGSQLLQGGGSKAHLGRASPGPAFATPVFQRRIVSF